MRLSLLPCRMLVLAPVLGGRPAHGGACGRSATRVPMEPFTRHHRRRCPSCEPAPTSARGGRSGPCVPSRHAWRVRSGRGCGRGRPRPRIADRTRHGLVPCEPIGQRCWPTTRMRRCGQRAQARILWEQATAIPFGCRVAIPRLVACDRALIFGLTISLQRLSNVTLEDPLSRCATETNVGFGKHAIVSAAAHEGMDLFGQPPELRVEGIRSRP